MLSRTIKMYAERNAREGLTEAQIAFADKVYAWAEANYTKGGDVIVEAMTPKEVCENFKSVKSAKGFARLKLDQAQDIQAHADY